MTSNLNPASQMFLANVNAIEQRLAQANQEVSSGLKISEPSDAPDQIAPMLQMRADIDHNQQIQSSLTVAQTNAQAADGALTNAIQLMNSALVLGDEGANSSMTADGLQSLAQEVQAIQQQMVACSQTTVQGRFIFSGDQDQSPAYQFDASAPKQVDMLSVSASTRQIENPGGQSFAGSMTAQQIFDSRNNDGTAATGNVFAALSGLQTALLSGNPQTVAQALTSINSASTHLNSMQSFYGNVENEIANAQSFSTTYNAQLETQLSQTEDADIPSAAVALTQAQTQLQAAFQMQASMPHKTLFDYLG